MYQSSRRITCRKLTRLKMFSQRMTTVTLAACFLMTLVVRPTVNRHFV